MKSFLKSETEKKIYYIILKYPGIHLTKISELLNIKISDLKNQLQFLEEERLIHSKEDSGFKRYYIGDRNIGSRDKRVTNTQQKIYELIQENPGLHLSKIAVLMQMRLSLAQYHLANLNRDNLIISITEDGYKRFYIKDSDIGSEDKKIVSLLRKEIPLQIVTFLLKKSNAKHKEILEVIDVSPSTLSYHLNKLVEFEIIEVKSYGSEKGYKIKNKRAVISVLVKYIVADGFKDLWDDFGI